MSTVGMSEHAVTESDGAVAEPHDESSADDGLYDAGYYRNYEGGTYDRGGHWTRFFGYIADEVVARWNPKVTLDAGCALGVFVEELRKRDVQAWGTDVSEYAISAMPEAIREYCRQGSLAEELHPDLPRHYDLVTCIEVLEHMERADADKAIGLLCSVSDRILFSSTPDGYAEPTHLACRPAEEWSAVFARHGFFRDFDADASFVAPWAVVYSRDELTAGQLAQRYDRAYSRLAEENRQLRAKVIELDKQTAATGDAALTEEIGRLRTELLAARDELAGAVAVRNATGGHVRDAKRQVEERTRARTVDEVEERMRQTTTWRIGAAVLRPAALARRAAGKAGRRIRPDKPNA